MPAPARPAQEIDVGSVLFGVETAGPVDRDLGLRDAPPASPAEACQIR